MKKIPTLFKRAANGFVIPELNEKAAWVLQEESTALRKYDGVCFMFDGEEWWNRRSWQGRIKQKMDMYGIKPVEYDPNTQKTFGWAQDGSFGKYLRQALQYPPVHADAVPQASEYLPGTYELVGPKINGNPEGFAQHRLIYHARAEQLSNINSLNLNQLDVQQAYNALAATLSYVLVEGAVFYGSEGQLAKIKRRDFPYAQAATEAMSTMQAA